MYTNIIFELSMVLDNDKFQKVLRRANIENDYFEEDDEYTDLSLAHKGITVKYRDSTYKKKISVIINSGMITNSDNPESDKFIRKLNKRINEYFNFKYRIDDFALSGIILIKDIDVHDRKNVSAYIKVLQRIGKVKRFSRSADERLDNVDSFCLDGNSNGILFRMYDLERMCRMQVKKNDMGLKSAIKTAEGIIRIEVHIDKPKVIRGYAGAIDVSDQIAEVLKKHRNIFLEIFVRIVPYGDFYKKDKAVEIVRSEVKDIRLRRKMLRLLALIPEKKSLYLAQKAMNYRNIEKIMKAFEKIDVSPVTISKRQDVKQLKNIYEYLFE